MAINELKDMLLEYMSTINMFIQPFAHNITKYNSRLDHKSLSKHRLEIEQFPLKNYIDILLVF